MDIENWKLLLAMYDTATLVKVGIVLFIAIAFIFALFKTIGFIIRLMIIGVIILLFLFFFGVPFLVAPLFSNYVCKGPVTATNVMTKEVRTFSTCFPPFGWQPAPSNLQ